MTEPTPDSASWLPPTSGSTPPVAETVAETLALPPPTRWTWRPKVRWFAAEYFIVVLGVLTAVALNAWWVGMQDRQIETETLREVRASLVNELPDIRGNLGSHQRGAESARLLRDHIRAQRPYADTLDAHFAHAFTYTFSLRDESGYETLKQRGLETITNDSMRTLIGTVYGVNYPEVIGGQNYGQDLVVLDAMRFERAHFRDIQPFQSATPVEYSVLLASTEYAAFLDYYVFMHSFFSQKMETLETNVVALIALLDEEIESR